MVIIFFSVYCPIVGLVLLHQSGVLIVFVKSPSNILSLYIPDKPSFFCIAPNIRITVNKSSNS